MKRIKQILAIVAVTAALALPASAQFGVQKTLWAVTDFTNNPAVVTNLASVVDCTLATDFSLEVVVNTTNACSGALSINWDRANQTTYFNSGAVAALMAPSSGWFNVPLTNGGTRFVWNTNITMDSAGYWRLTSLTNAAGQHITNISIRAYVKPQRTRKDY